MYLILCMVLRGHWEMLYACSANVFGEGENIG